MKNFACEICGAEAIVDDDGTRVVFCEHHKPQLGMKIASTYHPRNMNKQEKKKPL